MEKEQNEPQGVAVLKLAGMLAHLEVFKTQVDNVRGAGMLQKAAAADKALGAAAAVLTDLVFITHEYASRAARLEAQILSLENERNH